MFLDPRQRTVAIGIWITSFSVGAAIGPLLGGLVLELFWWGAAFLVAVPVMALLLVLGPRLLPEYRDPEAGRPDLASAALSIAAVLALIFGLKQVAQDGLGWSSALAMVAGLLLAAVFVRRQLRLDDPLVDLRLFRAPAFSASLATYGLGVFITFGGFLFLPQYLQLVRGLSPLEAGLWTLPWALAFILGASLTPILVRRARPAHLMSAGLVLAAVGFAIFTLVEASSGFWLVVAGSVAFSLGTAPLFTLTNDLIIGSVPPERAGAAAGMSETAAEMGGALGIAAFGSLGVALYRGRIETSLPPELPEAMANVARDTLGGAVEVAASLPVEVGLALVDAARDAFALGFHAAAAASAVASIGLAVAVLALLRRVEPTGGTGDDGQEASRMGAPLDALPAAVPLEDRPAGVACP